MSWSHAQQSVYLHLSYSLHARCSRKLCGCLCLPCVPGALPGHDAVPTETYCISVQTGSLPWSGRLGWSLQASIFFTMCHRSAVGSPGFSVCGAHQALQKTCWDAKQAEDYYFLNFNSTAPSSCIFQRSIIAVHSVASLKIPILSEKSPVLLSQPSCLLSC